MSAKDSPKTIEQLSRFCATRAVPLNRMRFFIGEDCRDPKAFGIYQNVYGDFVVYKNKDDGTSVIRYRGPDEEHAVQEIFTKLESEIQRNCADPNSAYKRSQKTKVIVVVWITCILFLALIVQKFLGGGVKGGAVFLVGFLLTAWIRTSSMKRFQKHGYTKVHAVRWVEIEWLHWDAEGTDWPADW